MTACHTKCVRMKIKTRAIFNVKVILNYHGGIKHKTRKPHRPTLHVMTIGAKTIYIYIAFIFYFYFTMDMENWRLWTTK